MFDVMSQAKNAMEAYSTKLRAITANITNMSVSGYKRTDISFETLFSKLIGNGTSASMTDNSGGTNPVQLGGTAAIAASSIDFSMGSFAPGSNSDLGLTESNKLFITSNDGGSSFLYSRSGEFQVDPYTHKLVTKTGAQVYGFRRTSGVDSTSIEPIDMTGLTYNAADLTWNEDGIMYSYWDLEAGTYGDPLPWRIAVTSFNNPSGLTYRDATTFAESLSSGPASRPMTAAGIAVPRKREGSNVTYTSEVVDSMEIQRALDASLTVIKMANDTITGFINKLS